MRVFIVAPTPMLRAGLRTMLTSAAVQVVGEANRLPGGHSELAGAEILILADEDLLADSLQTLANRTLAVILLSDNERAVSLLRGLPLRGWGLVSPQTSAVELGAALEAVAQGLVVLAAPLLESLLGQSALLESITYEPLDEPLSGREREVLEHLSQGLSNKMIARQLGISEHTVKFHVSSLYTKLGASSRADAVSRGARRGLITL